MKPFSSSYSTSTDALEKVRGEVGSSSRRDEGNRDTILFSTWQTNFDMLEFIELIISYCFAVDAPVVGAQGKVDNNLLIYLRIILYCSCYLFCSLVLNTFCTLSACLEKNYFTGQIRFNLLHSYCQKWFICKKYKKRLLYSQTGASTPPRCH